MNEQQNSNMPVESSGKSKTTLIIIALVILGLGGGYYYFNSSKKADEDTTAGSVETSMPTQDSLNTQETQVIREVIVLGNNYSFEPKEIKARKGEKIRVVFKNDKGVHDFKIDELSVATKLIKAGEEAIVVIDANKVGTFEYYCSVGNHRQLGMKGNFIVEE